MPRFKWIYLEGEGVQHHVELFHGRRNGHVLLTCNGKVILTDFDVRQSKSYTFFINEEMCKVHLKHKGIKFKYSFEIDRKVDTPLNRIRKERSRKYNFYVALIFILVVLTAFWSISFGKKMELESKRIAFSSAPETGITPKIYGKLLEIEEGYAIQTLLPNNESVIKPLSGFYGFNGWPLQDGQAYEVKLEGNSIIEILWNKPDEQTLNEFRNKVLQDIHLDSFNEYGYTDGSCIIKIIEQQSTAFGLACMYYAKTSPDINAFANEVFFERIMNSREMKANYDYVCTTTLNTN
jgi:hypothetical protein